MSMMMMDDDDDDSDEVKNYEKWSVAIHLLYKISVVYIVVSCARHCSSREYYHTVDSSVLGLSVRKLNVRHHWVLWNIFIYTVSVLRKIFWTDRSVK